MPSVRPTRYTSIQQTKTFGSCYMQAEIISIGTEILMGELVDTNSSFLAAELAKIGVELR